MSAIFQSILEKITGLNPTGILCVGKGFVREEWKALCFKHQKAISQSAILGAKQIAQLIVLESSGRTLEGIARVELLRAAFKDANIRDALPTLAQQKLRPRFFENLDFSLQQGRLLFAHSEESMVFEERLKEKTGIEPKREEFFLLNRYWERLLEVREFWDDARLYSDAVKKMRDANGGEPSLLGGKEIFKLEHFPDLPREEHFWNELSRSVSVTRVFSRDLVSSKSIELIKKRTHSLEDAALFLIDEIIARSTSEKSLKEQIVVIPDEAPIRRTLKRVAEGRGLVLQDPRDPTLVAQSEELKLATLELEMASKRFPSPLVLAWIGYQPSLRSTLGELRKIIIESAIQTGLQSYRNMTLLYSLLQEVEARYPSKLKLTELKEKIKESSQLLSLPGWVMQVLDRLFQPWEQGLEQAGVLHRRWPLRYWHEQVMEKLKRTTPVSSPLKFEHGLQIYRVDQGVSLNLIDRDLALPLTVHFFGVRSSTFETRDPANEWLSARDQDFLSLEFGLPSFRANEAQAVQSFETWAKASTTPIEFWDYEYDEAGSECENADLALANPERFHVLEEHSLGMHPSLQGSFFQHLRESVSEVHLPLPKEEWPVSFLNAYGSCPFTAYSGYVLQLYDERETDFELKGDSFGNLVHQALENLIQHKKTPEASFEEAWKKTDQKAWLQSERLYQSIRYKTLRILNTLLESEAAYLALSDARPEYFEMGIEWKKEGLTFKGRIDRIDQHGDGLILIDYKTGSGATSGKKIMEKGQGLQLPIYALAVSEQMNQPIVAAQYLQLSPEATNRHQGILFTQWNRSKKADPVEHPITTARSNSHSLFTEGPEAVWKKLDHKIGELISNLKKGVFSAQPVDPQECGACRYLLVCGFKRKRSEFGISEEE